MEKIVLSVIKFGGLKQWEFRVLLADTVFFSVTLPEEEVTANEDALAVVIGSVKEAILNKTLSLQLEIEVRNLIKAFVVSREKGEIDNG